MAEEKDMTDKKTFGCFIKEKRIQKNYSQKDLADLLFVTKDAVSKWERGVSYPDISLISDICCVLNITEHEFITAANDPTVHKEKTEARLFRRIRKGWILAPTIGYGIALLVCFIVNLAVSRTLSWFFIVLTALLTAFTFIPTLSVFFEKRKLLIFVGSSFLSICLLLLTCGAYTHTLYWVPIACLGLAIGYSCVFLPVLLAKTNLSHYKFVISFVMAFVFTVLLIVVTRQFFSFPLGSAMAMTGYGYAPFILCAVFCLFHYDSVLKAGVCAWVVTMFYALLGLVTNALFGTNENYYRINYGDWHTYSSGNVFLIVLLSFIGISLVLTGIGIYRQRSRAESEE